MNRTIIIALLLLSTTPLYLWAQTTDEWLLKLLKEKGSPLVQHVLNNPDSFHYQVIYAQIDRNKKNKPSFKAHHIRLNAEEYFNPASTVKLPTALIAFEKLNRLHSKGIDRNTTMLTDSGHSSQTKVLKDATAENGLPSIGHYAKKIFVVSDNDAYNRLYEFVGQQELNEALWEKGYTGTRITRRFVRMTEEENRNTNPVRFMKGNELIYAQPAAKSNIRFDFSKRYLIGNAHMDRNDSLVKAPFDFTTHNVFTLSDMHQMLKAFIFPEAVKKQYTFNISEDDRSFLLKAMSTLPFEAGYPTYDTTEFFDSYTKFLYFRAGKQKLPSHIKVFNKAGWSYGFLTDNAYIIDIKNNIEFMLAVNIYANSDGVLNDDKYDHERVSYQFFKEIGEIIYQHELQRRRKHRPDLSYFSSLK